MFRPIFRPWLWAPFILVVDFVTKRMVLANEAALRGKIEILGEFLRFIYVRNPGSAMGLFPVGRVFLVAFDSIYQTWYPILWWLAAITMVVANLIALVLLGPMVFAMTRDYFNARQERFSRNRSAASINQAP